MKHAAARSAAAASSAAQVKLGEQRSPRRTGSPMRALHHQPDARDRSRPPWRAGPPPIATTSSPSPKRVDRRRARRSRRGRTGATTAARAASAVGPLARLPRSPPCASTIARKRSHAAPESSARPRARRAPRRASRLRAREPSMRAASSSVSSRTSAGPAAAQHLDRLAHLERVAHGLAERLAHVGDQRRRLAPERARGAHQPARPGARRVVAASS